MHCVYVLSIYCTIVIRTISELKNIANKKDQSSDKANTVVDVTIAWYPVAIPSELKSHTSVTLQQ